MFYFSLQWYVTLMAEPYKITLEEKLLPFYTDVGFLKHLNK